MRKLYRIIVDVQGFEELAICNELYDGIDNIGAIYSDFNREADGAEREWYEQVILKKKGIVEC